MKKLQSTKEKGQDQKTGQQGKTISQTFKYFSSEKYIGSIEQELTNQEYMQIEIKQYSYWQNYRKTRCAEKTVEELSGELKETIA